VSFSLNIAKDKSENWWLTLTESESGEMEPLALFVTERHSNLFSEYMESQGYIPIPIPTEDDYNRLLGGDS
jgi:hypothetical protein